MLRKLQRKTLVYTQVIGYALTLFIGASIALTTIQLFLDVAPLLDQQSDVFKGTSAVISKNVSLFKTLDKNRIYFTQEEMKELEGQSFVKAVSIFNNATFKVTAYTSDNGGIQPFYTELFFESIPDAYLDVAPDDWQWDSTAGFTPIIIPENYLNLYNFGFAESQGLPVLSKNTISQIGFHIRLKGNGQTAEYRGRIVGFSNKINSILVPDDFLRWANRTFGRGQASQTSRLLVELTNPADEHILQYFNSHDYDINKEKLEISKMLYFFRFAMLFVLFIAVVITLLSIAFVLLSMNLIVQKNKEMILNLYNIGYSARHIATFYQVVINTVSLIAILLAVAAGSTLRSYYLEAFARMLEFEPTGNHMLWIGLLISAVLVFTYSWLLKHIIHRAVQPT